MSTKKNIGNYFKKQEINSFDELRIVSQPSHNNKKVADKLDSIHFIYKNKKKSRLVSETEPQTKLSFDSSLGNIKSQRKINTMMNFFISFLIMSFSYYEVNVNIANGYVLTDEMNFIRISICFLAGCQILLVIHYYFLVKSINKLITQSSYIYQEYEISTLVVIEGLICIVFIPPYVSYQVTFFDISINQTIDID